MKKANQLIVLIVAVITLISLTACGGENNEPQVTPSADVAAPGNSPPAVTMEPVELIIFAAASMKETLSEIAELYNETAPNVTLTLSFESSGTLLTQIQEGADCDVFISAA